MFDLGKELFYKSVFDKFLERFNIDANGTTTSDECVNLIVTNIQQSNNEHLLSENERLKRDNQRFREVIRDFMVLNSGILDNIAKKEYESLLKSHISLISEYDELKEEYTNALSLMDASNHKFRELESKERDMTTVMRNIKKEMQKIDGAKAVPFQEINRYKFFKHLLNQHN